MAEVITKVIIVSDKRTSIKLIYDEWEAIEDICKIENIKRNYLLEQIDLFKNENLSLSCAIRLFILTYFHHLSNNNPLSAIFTAIETIV